MLVELIPKEGKLVTVVTTDGNEYIGVLSKINEHYVVIDKPMVFTGNMFKCIISSTSLKVLNIPRHNVMLCARTDNKNAINSYVEYHTDYEDKE